ncbi:MAG: helix-turn-helix domain-containing protein [Ruminiclostridium sp.]
MKNSREDRLKKTVTFSKNLRDLRDKKGISTAEMANLLKRSVSYTTSLINGSRAPSSDLLCSIAATFADVSFADVVYYFVNEENLKFDNDGLKSILVWKMNNGRGPTAGVLRKVSENDLIKSYGSEYKKDKFFYFLKKYMAEELYKGVYELYLKNNISNMNSAQFLQHKMETNHIFKNVVELLYTTEDEDLIYIKEHIDLFNRRIQRKKEED